MPAKTPMYLKTTTPKRGKKLKLRDVLSSDMISPPLGDMRHSAHVGLEGEGDMFGDVGFLQGKMDMLPALNGLPRSHSMERQLDEVYPMNDKGLNHSCNNHRNPYHHSTSLLKSTISMPVFIAPEQAPPKPPRLHLEDLTPPSQQQQQQQQQHQPQPNNHNHNDHNQQRHQSLSVCDQGVGCYMDPCHDLNYSASFRHLVPSSGSFSEVSSEDSMSESCGPLEPQRGLSLDSDAGLSNEDLRSERSESPTVCPRFSPCVSRSESLMGLDLDLGPSILEDVLRIMDRYKSVDDHCDL
ncbi:cdc42 effector protein 3 [Oncorhynchus mykiss]|uniref:cdc42 effector protein 3 n=1 Tax=Oncorhynchus mykiss TaxID=8022 RepID=UPI0018782345|nr:cdc42 effector protein 3 [Oncorhynchus mykiss]